MNAGYYFTMMRMMMFIMTMLMASVSCNINTAQGSSSPNPKEKPHILLIVADDLGWNDVSWHNPDVLTPNLQKLAQEGVILNRSYVLPICTPTRSALMTGRYPFTIGRQRSTIRPSEPVGLTLNATLLPQALKEAGYTTHAVGKWHLGFCSWAYTPTYRGFDTFYGYYTGAENYYTHMRSNLRDPQEEQRDPQEEQSDPQDEQSDPQEEQSTSIPSSKIDEPRMWLDLRNNTQPDPDKDGIYSSYLFASYVENLLETRNPKDPMFLYLPFQSVHAPLMVPENYTKHYKHIHDQDRRIYLGMVTALDEAVGRVVEALKTTGHYNNSVIVFTTDNGGTINHGGNNWPLRGMKTTFWEGGTRGVAFVHSPLLPNPGTISNKLLHATDWFRTLTGLGGGTVPDGVDGFDQWDAITGTSHSPRTKMVYNIDKTETLRASVRIGNYKLIVGFPGEGDWTPPPELSIDQEERKSLTVNELQLIPNHESLDWALPIKESIRKSIRESIGESTQYHSSVDLSVIGFLGNTSDESSYLQSSMPEEIDLHPPTLLSKLLVSDSNPINPRHPLGITRISPSDNPIPLKQLSEAVMPTILIENNHYNTIQQPYLEEHPPTYRPETKSTTINLHKGNLGKHSNPSYLEMPLVNPLVSGINREYVQEEVTWEIIRHNNGPINNAWEKQYSQDLLSLIKNETEFRLYNVKEDPEERNNLAEKKLHKVKVLLEYILEEIVNRYVPADVKDQVPSANPKYWNNIWSPGWCNAI